MKEANHWKEKVIAFDERRDIVIPGDTTATIAFSIQHFLAVAKEAIADHGFFSVALSGGKTPQEIFKTLPLFKKELDWEKILLFWSDERNCSPDHPDSNYRMAMDSGLSSLPFLPQNIFRMVAEKEIEEEAKAYDRLIRNKIPNHSFDLVMLGMGEDGHIASLFPYTHGLHTKERVAIGNYIPSKETWRMTLTFECINAARHIALYVLGKNKSNMVAQILTGPYEPDRLPAQAIGTPLHKALWILDESAAEKL